MQRENRCPGRELAPVWRCEVQRLAQRVAMEGNRTIHIADELDDVGEFHGFPRREEAYIREACVRAMRDATHVSAAPPRRIPSRHAPFRGRPLRATGDSALCQEKSRA